MGASPSKPSSSIRKHPSSAAVPQPVDPPAAVATMNQDIAFMVCAELHHSGLTSDLFSAAQVSTLWNVAAMPWLYRSLTLDFEDTKSVLTAHLLKILLKTDKKYRHYVQKLNIKMPSTEGDNSRRRLKPNVLKVLARLVPMLPMLKSFTWEVPEPMPRPLLEVLHNHPNLSNRAALFTCWGTNEDRQYLENLGASANLSELVIEFRPRRNVTAEQLAELMFYQKQLLLKQQSLKSLSIKYRYKDTRPFIDQIHMEREERLPSIERLSLDGYRFRSDHRAIQFHIIAQSVRSLTLIAPRDWHLLLENSQMNLSQLIIRGPRWKMDPWTAVSERLVLQSFLCKRHRLEELELESVGIPHAIVGKIVERNGRTIRKLRIHTLEHAVFVPGNKQPAPQSTSIPSYVISSIQRYCTHLRSLELDLTETDISGHTIPVRILETFTTLKHLQINTQLSAPALDQDNPYMAVVRVRNLACEIWSCSLETFRLVTRSLAQDGTQLGRDGSWLATRNFNDLGVDEWDVEIVDEITVAAERKLRVWARAVNTQFDPPTDEQERLQWEKSLQTKVEVAGAKALKALR